MRSIKVKFYPKNVFVFLLVLTYAVRAITDAIYVQHEVNSFWVSVKYITLLLAIVYGFFNLLQSKKPWRCEYMIRYIGFTVFVFLFISGMKMLYQNTFSTAVIEVAIHMLFPAIITVMAMSILNAEDIYNLFSCILIVAFSVYCIFEIGFELFTKDNFGLISFSESLSPFESHYTSGTATALCAYFAYFRKKKSLTILSFVFSLLTFKRMLVLCSLVLICLPLMMNTSRKVSRRIPNFMAIVFCVLTLAYYWCLIPENREFVENMLRIESVTQFTSTRSTFFAAVYSSPFFINFGWGACEAHLGRQIEMELIQILIELSIVGLVVFVFSYWKITGTSIYAIVYMSFNFLNMLASHSFQNGFIWCIILITFAQIEAGHSRHVIGMKKRKRIKIKI